MKDFNENYHILTSFDNLNYFKSNPILKPIRSMTMTDPWPWPPPLPFPWRWLELETGANKLGCRNKLEFDKLLSSLKSWYRESFEAPPVELTFVISWKGGRLIVGSSFSRLILRKSINSGSGLGVPKRIFLATLWTSGLLSMTISSLFVTCSDLDFALEFCSFKNDKQKFSNWIS